MTSDIDLSELHASCDSVRTVDDFKRWIKTSIRPILPHESLICGLGHLHAGGVSLDCLITIDFPVGHIQTIRNRAGAIDTPILRRWLATQEPVYFDAEYPWPGTPATSHLAAMSESTVKHHLTRIYEKLGIETRSQLVRYLVEHESRQVPGGTTKVL